MTNPLSVLLIIGAAVVGPVEAQDKGPRLPPGASMCSDHSQIRCLPTNYESLPELCERAMREVGAEKWADNKWYWALGADLNHHLGPLVRCIPTPTGYRR